MVASTPCPSPRATTAAGRAKGRSRYACRTTEGSARGGAWTAASGTTRPNRLLRLPGCQAVGVDQEHRADEGGNDARQPGPLVAGHTSKEEHQSDSDGGQDQPADSLHFE